MKLYPAVQYTNSKGKEILKRFNTPQQAKTYFTRLDNMGKIAMWGDYVSSPFPMLLVEGESKALIQHRATRKLQKAK